MGSARAEMAGQVIGRLTVLEYSGRNKDKRALWKCRCECGAECVVMGKYLRRGLTKSCGCLHREMVAKINASHGMSDSPTYMSWAAMLTRCSNPNQECYKYYGALGVTVCDRWRKSFENFLADMGERPDGKTLDRESPFGNYEPENCKWSTPKEQANNTRGQHAIAKLRAMEARPVEAFESGYTRI